MPVVTLPAAPEPPAVGASAVLTGGCDGYPAGTTGRVLGEHQRCVVFAPCEPERVARWAQLRATVLVPPALLVVAD